MDRTKDSFMKIINEKVAEIIDACKAEENIMSDGIPKEYEDILADVKENLCKCIMDSLKDLPRMDIIFYPADEWRVIDVREDNIGINANVVTGKMGDYEILCPLFIFPVDNEIEKTAYYYFCGEGKMLAYECLPCQPFDDFYDTAKKTMLNIMKEIPVREVFEKYVERNMPVAASKVWEILEKKSPDILSRLKPLQNYYYDDNHRNFMGVTLEVGKNYTGDYAKGLYEKIQTAIQQLKEDTNSREAEYEEEERE